MIMNSLSQSQVGQQGMQQAGMPGQPQPAMGRGQPLPLQSTVPGQQVMAATAQASQASVSTDLSLLPTGVPMNVGPQQGPQPGQQPGPPQQPMQVRPNPDKVTQILMHLERATPEQRTMILQKFNMSPDAQQNILQRLRNYQIQKQQQQQQRQMSMLSQQASGGMMPGQLPDILGASGMASSAQQPQPGQQQPPQQHQLQQPTHQDLHQQQQQQQAQQQQTQALQPGAGGAGLGGMGMALQRQQFPVQQQQQQPPPQPQGGMEQSLYQWQS